MTKRQKLPILASYITLRNLNRIGILEKRLFGPLMGFHIKNMDVRTVIRQSRPSQNPDLFV